MRKYYGARKKCIQLIPFCLHINIVASTKQYRIMVHADEKKNKLNLMIKRFVFLPELIIQGNGVKTSRKCNAASAKLFAYVEPYQQKINTFPPVLKGSELRTWTLCDEHDGNDASAFRKEIKRDKIRACDANELFSSSWYTTTSHHTTINMEKAEKWWRDLCILPLFLHTTASNPNKNNNLLHFHKIVRF